MNTGIPRNQNDGIYDTYGDAQGDKLSLREGHVIYVRSASLYAEVVTTVTPYPITGSNPVLYIKPQNTTPGTGETNTGSNIGLGDGVFAQKSGTDLQFYSQVSQCGIESHLVGNTYYRGLNPFVADNIGAFVGDMATSRTTTTTVINRSGVLISVDPDTASYGEQGLSCFDSFTNLIVSSEDFSGAPWSLGGGATIESFVSDGPDLKQNSASRVLLPATNSRIGCSYGSFSSNSYYDGSIFVKGLKGDTVSLLFEGLDSNAGVTHTLTGQWDRISVNIDTTGFSNSSGFFTLRRRSSDTSAEVLVFGAQLTNSSGTRPYAKTVSSEVITTQETHEIPVNGNMPKQGAPFTFVIDTSLINDGNQHYAAYIRTGNNIILGRFAGSSQVVSAWNGSVARKNNVDRGIHRFAIRFDGTTLDVFVDGVKGETSSTPEMVYLPSDNITLGADANKNNALNSYMKIKKWVVDGYLTDQQIADLGGPDNVIL